MPIGTNDLLENIVGLGRPDKGLGFLAVLSNIGLNGFDQLSDLGEDAATQLLRGQVAKESLHNVQTGCGGRCEMDG